MDDDYLKPMTRGSMLAATTAAAAMGAFAPVAANAAAPAAPESASELPPDIAALVQTLAPRNGRIAAERVRAVGAPVDVLMRRLIPWAKTFADPPISHFFVGAIVEGASGDLYAGMNLEYPGQPMTSTVHGEGAAATNAWLHDESGIVSLAVGGVPCGYCRQFLSEFVVPDRLRIWMPDGGNISLAEALPHAFLPAVLGVTVDPFHTRTELRLAEPGADALTAAALSAATRSHAPYSKTLSGIALRLADDTVVTGRYAENVAFDPGMPALQSALVALRLSGYRYDDIRAAILVDTDGAASQRAVTQAVLGSISQAPVRFARAVIPG